MTAAWTRWTAKEREKQRQEEPPGVRDSPLFTPFQKGRAPFILVRRRKTVCPGGLQKIVEFGSENTCVCEYAKKGQRKRAGVDIEGPGFCNALKRACDMPNANECLRKARRESDTHIKSDDKKCAGERKNASKCPPTTGSHEHRASLLTCSFVFPCYHRLVCSRLRHSLARWADGNTHDAHPHPTPQHNTQKRAQPPSPTTTQNDTIHTHHTTLNHPPLRPRPTWPPPPRAARPGACCGGAWRWSWGPRHRARA